MSEYADEKWNCEYCTYQNFAASKRCTLCRAPKQLQYINEAERVGDIYKMAPCSLVTQDLPQRQGSPKKVATSRLYDPDAKWSCEKCTYLNWPRSHKCTQCLSPKSDGATVSSMKPLSINVNIEERAISCGSPNRLSPRISPQSPSEAKAANNDRNRPKAGTSRGGAVKWSCQACTYENWPKANKCSLCGTVRDKNFVEALGACSNSRETLSNRKPSRHSPPGPSRKQEYIEGATASANMQDSNIEAGESRIKQIRNKMHEIDWLWLGACQGVVEGDIHSVESYLTIGGDPARQITQDEMLLLGRKSAFEVGYTLVHLAIRFKREDILAILLTSTDVPSKAIKRMPSHVSPDIAAELRREISASLRQRKGDFPCYFVAECATFSLPADIEDLPAPIQKQLYDELLDQDVQKELEVEEPVINWSVELTERYGSRLYALWNRTAGDCLLDSVLQATWGIFDRDNSLRRALADTLNEGAITFFPRWKEYESMQAQSLHFSLAESQWQEDWAVLLSLASQPGAALEQLHIFALAHILRRPVIVYGVKFVKSFRGETIGYARFQGVYLPILWEQSFCWKSPIALGYTRGHFSALVPMDTDCGASMGAGANLQGQGEEQVAYLPLMDSEGKLLPVHFLTGSELNREEIMLREWMDVIVTDGGLLVAQQKLTKNNALVSHMMETWLDRYRRLSHAIQTSHTVAPPSSPVLSSDGETDDE
ncbi:unnamed protein product [Owenia fusiformis]|uniref:ubiquitinyl hydrolase 1 n=1 Tax=Owenia fusiformis TaxID=6347 RepID=A0A8S4NMK8_OWEFU|nr:unnamed protein product [Owenia fusiformis]